MADMGMVGVRDILFFAPAAPATSSFHSHHHQEHLLLPSVDHHQQQHPIIPLHSVDDQTRNTTAGIHLWQQHGFVQNPNPNLRKPMAMLDTITTTTGHTDPAGFLGGLGESVLQVPSSGAAATMTTTSSSGVATCQDCGNQAKKDCGHRRCRTCCKSRGFDCSTHVKSTWISAARRRETSHTNNNTGNASAVGSTTPTSGSKKPRLMGASGSNNTPPHSFDSGSSHQDASLKESLPGQVRAPATFKCVRVAAMGDVAEVEFAYQAMVRIGGHVFKGFLYDQGVKEGADHHINQGGDDHGNNNNNNNGGIPNLSELHLGGGGGDVYTGCGGLAGGGMAYGNHIS